MLQLPTASKYYPLPFFSLSHRFLVGSHSLGLQTQQPLTLLNAMATDTALWPPSHFLAGDDQNIKINGKSCPHADFGFPSEFPYEFGVSSPAVESVEGSTETESSDGEEDFFTGLSRRLSQSSLHETRKQLTNVTTTFSEIPKKCKGLVGSPQSTLAGIGSWSGRSGVSGDGSPNGFSRVPSPSTTPFDENNDPWEVIYAVAGQVARLKINNTNNQVSQFGFQNNRGLLTQPRPNEAFNQVQQQVRPKQQCGSIWGKQVKPTWLVQQQQLQVRNRGCEFGNESMNVKCPRSSCLPQSAWPPLQVQNQNNRVQFGGSGSRIVSGGSSVKRGRGGTGVFLPRHYEAPSEPRKNTDCAPVLLPAKAVHALNLNIDDPNGTSQTRFSNAFATDYEAILARRNALLMQQMQQRLSVRREETASYEIRLPQEWTY